MRFLPYQPEHRRVDIEGTTALSESSPPKYHFMGATVILAILVAGGIFVLASNLSKKPLKDAHLSVAKATSLQEEIKAILDMPEKDEQEIIKKSKALENFLDEKIGKGLWGENYQRLSLRRKEYQAENAYKKLPNDLIARWIALAKTMVQYQETNYAKENLRQEQKKLEEQIVLLGKKQVEELSDLLAGKNYDQLTAKSMDWLSQILSEAYPIEGFQKQIESVGNLCKKASVEYSTKSEPVAPLVSKEAQEKDALQSLKKEFNEFLIKYRNYQKDREFQRAFNDMQPILSKLESLQDKYSEDPDVGKMLKIFREIILMQKLWDRAMEGAEFLQGKSVFLLLQNLPPIAGTIKQYRDGRIHIETMDRETRKPRVKTIALNDLAPNSLANLALQQNPKNAELYTALACFYYIEKEDSLCRSAINNALKNGASNSDIEEYQNWAMGILEETKKKLAAMDRANEDELSRQQQNNEEVRMERLRAKAKNIVRGILKDYKDHRETQVLDGLYILKTEVGDRPGGRDELIKLHFVTKKEEGQGLKEIALSAYEYCAACRNSANIKCPDCKGEGKIEGKERWFKGDKGIKIKMPDKYCNRCKATGDIYCPTCYEKPIFRCL